MFKKYTYHEIDNVVFELLNQKAVIIPTDTVIGIISKDQNLIYEIKNRPKSKKIITFLADHSQLEDLNESQRQFINEFWPGPVTIIKKAHSYRIPNDKYLLYILSKVGPLYSSSANISDHQPINSATEANIEFNEDKFFNKLVIVDGNSISDTPSTIVDLDKWEILRVGQKFNEIKQFISDLNKQKRTIYLLLDNELFSWSKTIKKSLSFSINCQTLNNKNFHHIVTNNSFLSTNSDLLIITKTPMVWDELANKTPGLRSGVVYNNDVAELIKKHDDVQVAIFDASMFDMKAIIEQINFYLNASFEGGRHQARVQTIINYEREN